MARAKIKADDHAQQPPQRFWHQRRSPAFVARTTRPDRPSRKRTAQASPAPAPDAARRFTPSINRSNQPAAVTLNSAAKLLHAPASCRPAPRCALRLRHFLRNTSSSFAHHIAPAHRNSNARNPADQPHAATLFLKLSRIAHMIARRQELLGAPDPAALGAPLRRVRAYLRLAAAFVRQTKIVISPRHAIGVAHMPRIGTLVSQMHPNRRQVSVAPIAPSTGNSR